MKSIFEKSIELEIDLTFSSPTRFDCVSSQQKFQISLLGDYEFWANQLKSWIEYIRSDPILICPEELRRINSIGIGLEFTDDNSIAELNQKWRKKSDVTDVLSFPVFDPTLIAPEETYAELGDIVVSVPMAQRQAIEQNHPLNIELAWLVSHGLLHLLGWDHPDAKTLENMLRFQEQLLKISGNLSNTGT